MTSQLRPTGSTRRWRKLREQFATHLATIGPLPCARCGEQITAGDEWDLGHQVDRVLGGDDTAVWPEHRFRTGDCPGNRSAGASLRAALRDAGVAAVQAADDDPKAIKRAAEAIARVDSASASAARFLPPPPGGGDRATVRAHTPKIGAGSAEASRFDPASLDDVPWLADLVDIPSDAAWPRHMTPPHPAAVGSYGQAYEKWVRKELELEPRWWHRLAARRQLEHDAEGRLLWQTIVESTPRRAGKSVRLRCGALWRIVHGVELFGEEQLALHTGKDLPIAKEIHRRAWSWAQRRGWTVRKGMGNEEIETPDGSRWAVRSRHSVYGYDVTYGMVDEGWGVEPAAVDEGLEPAILERLQPQLLLTSTAHRKATPLMRRRIGAALSGLGEDWSTLLMLWAAGPDDPIGEEASWRAASPHWSEDRRRLISARYERAMRGEADPEADDPDPIEGFRAQYLNVWPAAEGPKAAGETVVTAEEWGDLAVDEVEGPPLVTAVETWFGKGVSVATAYASPDGRPGVRVAAFGAMGPAVEHVNGVDAPVLLAGKSLTREPRLAAAEAVVSSSREATLDMRRLVDDRVFVHDGSPELTAQVLALRARPSPEGARLVSRDRVDAVKAAVWALQRARAVPEPREAPAIY